MESIVEITPEMFGDVVDIGAATFGSFNPLLLLILGVLLGLFALEMIIGIIERRTRVRREEASLRAEVMSEIISPYKRKLKRDKKEAIRREIVQEA